MDERHHEYVRQRYHRNKDAGICVQCGRRPAMEGKTRCRECWEREKPYKDTTYQWRKEHGICVRCGKASAEHGRYCLVCYGLEKERSYDKYHRDIEKSRQAYRDRYCRDKENGICVKCHNNPAMEGHTKCEQCSRKDAARKKRNYVHGTLIEERLANGMCRLCGNPVVPGLQVCPDCQQRMSRQAKGRWDSMTPEERARQKRGLMR